MDNRYKPHLRHALRRVQILHFMNAYHEDKKRQWGAGYLPNVREIAAHLDLTTGIIRYHLKQMVKDGLLDYPRDSLQVGRITSEGKRLLK